MKAIPSLCLLTAGFTCCCLVSCAPKNTKGQVFIVTRSAENIKLGLVEVVLLDEHDVTAFLAKKKPAVEAEISVRAENLRKCEQALQEAQHELEEFPKTNVSNSSVFIADKRRRADLKREVEDYRYERRLAIELADAEKFKELRARLEETVEKEQELNVLEEKLSRLQGPVDATNATFLKRLRSAESQFAEAKDHLEQFPSVNFYLADFSPVPVAKAVTDADGKFELKLPHKARIAVFAKSSRKVGANTENYTWFFWLPSATDKTPLLLSNNNLVFTDYAGNVLPVKPKETD